MRNKKLTAKKTGLALLLAAAAFSVSGCGSTEITKTVTAEAVQSAEDTIMVTGQEEVRVVPDIAEIVYSVRTQAADAASCQEENAKSLAQTIETLKGLGIGESSIQTSSYGLSPIYNWNSGTQEITGYEMDTQLTVSDISIDNVGMVLSQSVTAGVNQISSVSYSSSTYDEKYQEALTGAVEMARTKAQTLAAAGGKAVGEVANIEEYGYSPSARYTTGYYSSGARSNMLSAAQEDMAVMPGEISIEAQVNVTFTMTEQ